AGWLATPERSAELRAVRARRLSHAVGEVRAPQRVAGEAGHRSAAVLQPARGGDGRSARRALSARVPLAAGAPLPQFDLRQPRALSRVRARAAPRHASRGRETPRHRRWRHGARVQRPRQLRAEGARQRQAEARRSGRAVGVVEKARARRPQCQRRHFAAHRRPRRRRDLLRLPRAGGTHLKLFARLAEFLLPHKWRILFALLALLVAAGCVLALGQGLRLVIDAGFSSASPELLDQALAAMLAIAAVLAVATWFRFYLMMSTGERVVTDLRKAVFDHILGLDPAFFEAERTGEVISRLTNDTTLLQQVIGFGISMFVRNALMMVGAAVMLFVTSWKLAALVLLGVPATLIPILVLGRGVRRLSRASQDRVADVSAYVDEAIHEIRTAQAYAHEDADRAAFARHAEAAYAVALSRIRQKAFLIGSVILIAFSAVGIILWVGGHDVLAGRMSAGELSAFVFFAVVVATGAGTVSEVWGELQRAAGATERLMEL